MKTNKIPYNVLRNNETFELGEFVETNDNYFAMYGRRVQGIVVIPNWTTPLKTLTIVKWLHQEGNIIECQQNQMVMMLTRYLQRVKIN